MAPTRQQKVESFRQLHQREAAFVIPNPWDAGTAKILTALGFEALATTSAGFAFSLGKLDGRAAVTRDEALAHAAKLVAATHLPVSADLENCFGHAPEVAAETIILAAETGLAGGSIEDATADPGNPIYAFDHAVERVHAAAEAASGIDDGFVLTARADNFIRGRQDLDDTFARLQAYEAAGAEVLYAPGLPDIDAVRAVCSSLSAPFNLVMSPALMEHTIDELSEAGVRRISLGGALARHVLGAAMMAAREIQDRGTFGWYAQMASFQELGDMMAG